MIRFERASVARGGQIVVESLSCDWDAGWAVAVIGRAGAGKSAALAAAATVLPLQGGDILVAGRSVRRAPDAVRRVVGYVPATPPAWQGLRAQEFLTLFATAAGLSGAAARAAVERALGLAGVAGRETLETLAAGPAKQLLVARALLHDPAILLLDDPFAGLDPAGRARVEQLVGDAVLMGRTVVAALDDAAVPDCFTHVAVLREGRLVAEAANDRRGFAAGRPWRCRLVCPGAADAAARLLAGLATDVRMLDDDALTCRVDDARGSLATVVGTLVAAGVAVEQAGFDPPWTAQLLD